ncbi:MAG: hypothetical protein LUB59_01065 [Candidatus Gastranaerophilales bacterium]|nr:hypothetical protein [Candidatus Gastranaerophilales bacterium]
MVRSAQEYNSGYITDSFRRQTNDQVISGYFPKTGSVKAMAIKKINNTLCGLLLCAIFVSAISYYFVVSCEIKLNECSRVTTLINVENSELQNKLDKLKSFNNVDLTMQKNNLLHKPEKVIEALEVNSKTPKTEKSTSVPGAKPKIWSIGY